MHKISKKNMEWIVKIQPMGTSTMLTDIFQLYDIKSQNETQREVLFKTCSARRGSSLLHEQWIFTEIMGRKIPQ